MEILKIIETLQSYSEDVVKYKLDGKFAHAVTEAVELLVTQGEKIAELEEKNRWVPVTEPPKKDGRYLVLGESGNCFDAEYDSNVDDCGKFGEWVGYYDPHTLGYVDADWEAYSGITHWKPMPEPPEEETE